MTSGLTSAMGAQPGRIRYSRNDTINAKYARLSNGFSSSVGIKNISHTPLDGITSNDVIQTTGAIRAASFQSLALAANAQYWNRNGIGIDIKGGTGADSGNVGIGTSTPAEKLTVNGNCSISTTLAVTGAATVTGLLTANGNIAGTEVTEPAAPASNGYIIYAEDNGSGKTRLMVKFATGGPQQIEIEP